MRIDKSQSCNEKIYDYIIIGAGPAGCFCAMQLKEAGKDVLIIEKNNINDGKVCGDGISMKCVNLLKQLDFPLDRFVEAGAAQIHKRIIVRNGKREVTHFGWDDGTVSFGIPRNKTDYIFRSYAAEKGVEIVYLTNVSKITKNKEVFSVGDFFAKCVIVACGSFSRLSILGTNLKYYPKNMAVGISTTIKCKCEAEPCFLFDYDAMYKGQYAWIFKTDDDNWNVGLWLRHDKNKLNAYFYDFINNKLPTYIVNLKSRPDRRRSMEEQFDGKPEFEVRFVDAVKDADGAAGIWKSLVKVITAAQKAGHDKILFCEDDHIFTEHYTSDYLFRNIAEAETKGVDLLVGGACGYGTGVPIGDDLFWTDWYWGNQFLIIRKNIYSRILDFNFRDGNTADGVLSGLIRRKAILYPFVSVQREFGYSDITPTNGRKGFINDLFDDTARRLQSVRDITDEFNCRR